MTILLNIFFAILWALLLLLLIVFMTSVYDEICKAYIRHLKNSPDTPIIIGLDFDKNGVKIPEVFNNNNDYLKWWIDYTKCCRWINPDRIAMKYADKVWVGPEFIINYSRGSINEETLKRHIDWGPDTAIKEYMCNYIIIRSYKKYKEIMQDFKDIRTVGDIQQYTKEVIESATTDYKQIIGV